MDRPGTGAGGGQQGQGQGQGQRQGQGQGSSAVMERARQFNRLAEENRARSRSFDRRSDVSGRSSPRSSSSPYNANAADGGGRSRSRSRSTGRAGANNAGATSDGGGLRSKAMASVRSEYEAKVAARQVRSSPPPAAPQEYQQRQQQQQHEQYRSPSSRNDGGAGQQQQQQEQEQQEQEQQHNAIVTPELLVDALSGHEDGLLAIAERLMEHYDAGYDAMGEAIIDAFADVQKLFQHVVEAAHMEGAAFEASRREEEMTRLREAAGEGGGGAAGIDGGVGANGVVEDSNDYGPKKRSLNRGGGSGADAGPSRHDEFIDEDVREVLNDAIRRSRPLRDAGNYSECYVQYEKACNSASALLPVDSDHRGRLQLSIARAESMSADRACAILKYAMDDVLRSGLSVGVGGAAGGIDPSKRGDCVLNAPSLDGDPAVAQSSDEALASLVQEMKEVLSAPVYDNSPVQAVAARFWETLSEAQRSNVKTEERLEQKLASLKAEYLLAREEWEEKFGSVKRENDALRLKYNRLLQNSDESSQYMEEARRLANGKSFEGSRGEGSHRRFVTQDPSFAGEASTASSRGLRPSTASVASFSSGLAQHARSIVGTLSCVGPGGERYGPGANGVGGERRYNRSSSSSRGRTGRSRSDLGRDEQVHRSRSRSSRPQV